MACNCNKQSNVAYSVRFKDGSSQTYETVTLAQAAIRKAGGGQMRAVKKT